MRFSIDIYLKGLAPYQIPTNYRKNIISLIKEALLTDVRGREIYNEFWCNKSVKAKPFTFSLYVPDPRVVRSGNIGMLEIDSPLIRFSTSSNDDSFLLNLFNGLINIDRDFSPFVCPIELKNFRLRREKPINSNSIDFRVLSPVVVRNTEKNSGKKWTKGYLTCEDHGFNESLSYSILNLSRHLLHENYLIKADQIEIDSSRCSTVRINHYKEIIPATRGIISIKAPEYVLSLVYDAGLGARRSQGFGMLEVAG